jgi:hypothetical protein
VQIDILELLEYLKEEPRFVESADRVIEIELLSSTSRMLGLNPAI